MKRRLSETNHACRNQTTTLFYDDMFASDVRVAFAYA